MTNFPRIIKHNDLTAEDDQDKADLIMQAFEDKVDKIVEKTKIKHSVFNGKRRTLNLSNYKRTTCTEEIMKILEETKLKNSCGHDRIPMSFLVDGREYLAEVLANLFNKIFLGDDIPESWKISRIIPLHKKGNKGLAENYRPISNICSIAKIYEKLILKRIQELEKFNNIDLTGKTQHGFKKQHSTQTAMLELQNDVAELMDDNNYVGLVSLDLSAAFDVVNHELLIKRLHNKGLPFHLINLIKNWLTDRLMYVEVNSKCSILCKIKHGTVQGSVLGPMLFSLFISPVYELTKLTTYADDNYLLEHDMNIHATIGKVKMKAELTINWLRDSGMKVNAEKTEICVFSNNDVRQIDIIIDDQTIKTKNTIKILGVTFDMRLNWRAQIDDSINNCKRILHGINLIKSYFTTEERLHLINAFFYSKLYYCAPVWLHQMSNSKWIQKLKNISSQALRLVCGDDYAFFSFDELHCMFNRATPLQWSMYQHAVALFRIYNFNKPEGLWLELCDKINIAERTSRITINSNNKRRVGLNKFCNRLTHVTNIIRVNDLNLSQDGFKVKFKKEFIF
jgi:hypothetical protein